MKIIRKKEIKKMRVTHNSKLLWIILILIIALIAIICFIVQNNKEKWKEIDVGVKNCVPASCCHATECVLTEQAPDCKNMVCSAVCSGPLDCGAGSCEFIDNKCVIVSDK
ncbi:MAG: hypothetical protein WCX73_00275 [Candidatus Pacearchaeota archaeon]|jgi:hypothetical protein